MSTRQPRSQRTDGICHMNCSELDAYLVNALRLSDEAASKNDFLRAATWLFTMESTLLLLQNQKTIVTPKLNEALGKPNATPSILIPLVQTRANEAKMKLDQAYSLVMQTGTGTGGRSSGGTDQQKKDDDAVTCESLDIKHFKLVGDKVVSVSQRKNKAGVLEVVEKEQMTFEKISGMAREKDAMKQSFVYPFRFSNLFKNPGSILLYGPPGTGKTFLVRAAVGEIKAQGVNVALVLASGASMKGKYVGQTEKQIKAHFDCAQAEVDAWKAKNETGVVIIFIDEIDAIAGLRGDDQNMATSVNALIAQMDGFEGRTNVVVIGATNRPWSLDDAVLRRFNQRIMVDLGSDDTRFDIMWRKLKKYFGRTDWAQRIANTMTKEQRDYFYTRFNKVFGKSSGNVVQDMVNLVMVKTGAQHGASPPLTPGDVEAFEKNGVPRADAVVLDMYAKKTFETLSQVPYGYLQIMNRNPNALALSTFGYSNSDVDKLTDAALREMATRILRSCVHFHTCETYKTEEQVNKEECLLTPLTDTGKCTCAVIPTNGLEACKNVKNPEKLMTYNLTWADWEKAFGNFKSSINESIYVDLVRYSIWTKGPAEYMKTPRYAAQLKKMRQEGEQTQEQKLSEEANKIKEEEKAKKRSLFQRFTGR